jgi:hypothetical protein
VHVLRPTRRYASSLAVCAAGLLGAAAAVGEPAVVTDASSVNVCERVPGTEVARVLGKSLKSERPIIFKDSKMSRCVYLLLAQGKPDGTTEGVVLWLYTAKEYAELNEVTEAKLEPVPGLGDDAVRFRDSGDGRHKVRALRRGRYSIESTGGDVASALAVARLALERFDK